MPAKLSEPSEIPRKRWEFKFGFSVKSIATRRKLRSWPCTRQPQQSDIAPHHELSFFHHTRSALRQITPAFRARNKFSSNFRHLRRKERGGSHTFHRISSTYCPISSSTRANPFSSDATTTRPILSTSRETKKTSYTNYNDHSPPHDDRRDTGTHCHLYMLLHAYQIATAANLQNEAHTPRSDACEQEWAADERKCRRNVILQRASAADLGP